MAQTNWQNLQLEPLHWQGGIDVLPIRHGSALFAMAVRQCLWHGRYQALALAFPQGFAAEIQAGIDALPEVHALTFDALATPADPTGSHRCYLPFDPCDGYVEGWRQARQRKMPLAHLEAGYRLAAPRHIHLPDAQLLMALGIKGYHDLALRESGGLQAFSEWETEAQFAAKRLHAFRAQHARILLLCDYPILPWLDRCYHLEAGQSPAASLPVQSSDDFTATLFPVKPEHLYFALGEPPFFAGEAERERQNPLALPRPYFDLVKTLFLRTREHFVDNAVDRMAVSIKAVQQALTYTRNLAALNRSLSPTLFDLLTAAKGVLGAGFARRLLEAARYYPYFTFDRTDLLALGPESLVRPGHEAEATFNLLDDAPKTWRPFKLKQEPDKKKQRDYRYAWDKGGLCSHLPEDVRIERFNRTVRTRAHERDNASFGKVEKLTTSMRDGIDLRETLRHWHSGGIYVREIPPQRRRVDTIVVIFDDAHDERYPQHVTWYAEHADESTLTFYATEPMAKLIGPGIAEAEYGGFSLLFPPRHVPDIFSVPAEALGVRNLSEHLLYGALMHSRERAIALVSEKKPTLRMKLLARRFGRRIVHLPLAQFSTQTLKRLRKFHLLNGKQVRSWASRFIDE